MDESTFPTAAADAVSPPSLDYLARMYPFFEESRHVLRLTTRFEALFRDFGFRGLTIRGPHTSVADNTFCHSELDTTPPNRLIWVPVHSGSNTVYFYEIDFCNPVLQERVLMAYEGVIIGDSAAGVMPFTDVIVPIFPHLPADRIFALATLQLYGCVFTQDMLDAIATFPVGTLVLTGYACVPALNRSSFGGLAANGSLSSCSEAQSNDTTPNTLLVNGRVRILMVSLLSRHPLHINLAQINEMDYLCLGGAISTRVHGAELPADAPGAPAATNVGPVRAAHQLLQTNTLSELYVIVEGRRTDVRTLALLFGAADMVSRNVHGVLGSLGRIYKIVLGYQSCGVQCPIRAMQHTLRAEAACLVTKQTASMPEGSGRRDGPLPPSTPHILDVFECCAEKGVRHFAFDSTVSAHLEGARFETFAPYIDTLECQFIVGAKGAQHLPLVFAAVSTFEVFRWGTSVLDDVEHKTMQRLTPPSGKALRSIVIDKRLEWLGYSYIVVNCSNVVSLPKEGVSAIDERAQRAMLQDKKRDATAAASWSYIPYIY